MCYYNTGSIVVYEENMYNYKNAAQIQETIIDTCWLNFDSLLNVSVMFACVVQESRF